MGQPLQPALRRRLESAVQFDLRAIRVHAGPQAARAADRMQARAFTVGPRIVLGSNQRTDDVQLLAHETAHVLQQGAVLPAHGPRGPPPAALTPAPAGVAQRWSIYDIPVVGDVAETVVDIGEGAVNVVSTAAGVAYDLATGDFWGALERLVPSVVPTLREIANKGLCGFLEEKISGFLSGLFEGIQQVGNFFSELGSWLASLAAGVRDIAAGLASRGKVALLAAVRSMRDLLSGLAGEVWEAISSFFAPIGEFLGGVLGFFTGSVLPFLERLGGAVWRQIREWASDLWDLTAPVRDALSWAWDQISEILGLSGGGGGGGGGVLGWIQEQAEAVWNTIKEGVSSVTAPIQSVIRWLAQLGPLQAIRQLRARVQSWIDGATQLADSMEQADGVTDNREVLRDLILPAIQGAITAVRGGIQSVSGWVTGTIGSLGSSITNFLASLAGNSWLSFAAAPLGWLRDGAAQLTEWATSGVAGLFGLVDSALATVSRWVEPVLRTLQQFFATLLDLVGQLPGLVFGSFWRLIPAWIRDPVKDFLINRILRRIPVFGQLLALPNIWERVVGIARRILLQIFLDGDLLGAAWTFFRSVLEVFGLPPALVVNLIRNAARAIGDILRNPFGFIINLLRAVKDGFLGFLERFGRHLLNGIADWLFGTLGEAGIRVPREFSLRAVFDVVLQILGLTADHVFELLERRIGRERVQQIRRGLGIAREVFRYIELLVTGGPAALWEELRSQLTGLWERIIEGVMSFLMERLVATAMRWLVSLLDISGIMPVINSLIAIYRAIESFFRYLRQLLEIVNSVLEGIGEIARGVITRGAALVERNLARLLPVAIGFLANQVGLGRLGEHLRNVIGRIRSVVDRALLWLIDRIVAGLQAVVGAVRSGVAAVREWWRTRTVFRNAAGEEHTLSVQGEGRAAQLMIESTPVVLETYLRDYERRQTPSADDRETLRQIRSNVTQIENRKASSSYGPSDGEFIQRKLERIVELLRQLGGASAPPPTTVTWTRQGEDGKTMVASVLSLNPGGHAGSQPSEESTLWRQVSRRKHRSSGYSIYVRGHLLNHHLHGPGTMENLVPITGRANGRMERFAESRLKQAILGQRRVFRYQVEADFSTRPAGPKQVPEGHWPESRLPGRILLRATELTADGRAEKQGSDALTLNETVDVELPPTSETMVV